jgi:type 1 glutamine amidotransferase
MTRSFSLCVSLAAIVVLSVAADTTFADQSKKSADDHVLKLVPTGDGPGKGKHVVLIGGDEEYRSEETLPQLAKILAKHHGFTCTVLFSIDPETGEIDPKRRDNIPGLEALETADLMIIFTRRRNLPEEQMQRIVDYLESGRPVIGIRTATHAFHLKPEDKFYRYSADSKDPEYQGGFGRQVLGETWVAHHGKHKKQSTRGILAPGAAEHPIMRGIQDGDIWGPTDVYRVRLPLPGDSQPLVLGQVLKGMNPTDPPVKGEQNDPLMPVAWTKTYESDQGKPGRVFTTTMGSSQDLESEGFRRLLVNGCYWCVGLEDQIPEKTQVDLVGDYQPSAYGFEGFKKGVKPKDYLQAE